MSKENTNYDVSIKIYDGSKQMLAHIKFFNDCELLLDSDRIRVKRDGNRLLFIKDAGGVKFSQKSDTLQLWADVSKVRDMEGNYDLKYDKDLQQYYVDKSERISDCTYTSPKKGMKQLNHNPGNREKGVHRVLSVAINDKGKKVAEIQNINKTNEEKKVVAKALLQLLKTQLKGNNDALSTIYTLENYI